MIEVVSTDDKETANFTPVASVYLSYIEVFKILAVNFNNENVEEHGKSTSQTLKLKSGCKIVIESLQDLHCKSLTILCVNEKHIIESNLKELFELLKIDMNKIEWLREDIKLFCETNILSKNAQSPSRLTLILLVPMAWIIVYFTYLNNSSRIVDYHFDPLVLAFSVMAIGITISAFFPKKGWYGIRIVTFCMFLGYLFYFIDQFVLNSAPIEITNVSNANPFNALLGMLFYGIPCLLYTFWGSTIGRLGHANQVNVTKSDFVTLILSQVVFIAFLLISIGAMIITLSKMISY